jgi:hypothetical protein
VVCGETEYGSGLPFEFAGTYDQAVAEYGQPMVNRINFSDGRIKPNMAVRVSAGAELYKKETPSLRLHADLENLNNRPNVLDFAGLFSGTAIAPPEGLSSAWVLRFSLRMARIVIRFFMRALPKRGLKRFRG